MRRIFAANNLSSAKLTFPYLTSPNLCGHTVDKWQTFDGQLADNQENRIKWGMRALLFVMYKENKAYCGIRILLPQIFHRNICGDEKAFRAKLKGNFSS